MKKNWLQNYDTVVPEFMSSEACPLGAFLDNSAKKYPNKLAIKSGDFSLTYSEFKQVVEQVAANFKKHGINKGEKIAIFLPNCAETIIAFWAIQKAGATAVMTNPLYMGPELSYQFNDSEAAMLVTNDVLWPKAKEIISETSIKKSFIVYNTDEEPNETDSSAIFPWNELLNEEAKFEPCQIDIEKDLAVLQYTGGTTGVAKGCMLSHKNLSANAIQTRDMFHVLNDGEENFVGVLPYFHIYGLTCTVTLPVLMGAEMSPLTRFTPKSLLELIEKEKVTCMASAPAIFNACLQQKDLGNYDLSSLKLVISGSAPLPVKLMEKFEDITGAVISEGYGLSEASPVTHFNPIIKQRKPGSIGLPIPSTEATIMDVDTGEKELKPMEHGELVIKGEQVMCGYYKKADQTDMVLKNGWLYTGDIAYRDEDGYFFITDRKKDLIITGGYNVYPREIEEVLYHHSGIQEVVVIGVPSETRGEIPKAFIVAKEGQEQLTKRDVVDFCRGKLANYKLPKEVEFRSSLPKSAVGKLLRRKLREEAIA
jgi:long-chain acyl-CoA synthetase